MAEQVIINVSSQSSETSHSDEESTVQMQESDASVKLSSPVFKNEEEGRVCNASNVEKAVHLVPDKEHTENSTTHMSLLPEQESGVRQPTEKIIERKSLEESVSGMPVNAFQKVCSKDFGSASTAGREDRVLNTFLSNDLDTFQCDIEEENTQFESIPHPPTFDMHERGIGDKPYGCKYCTRRFSHRSSLYRHQKSHTGDKLYKCPECNKAFTNSSNLSVHSRIHTGEKPYECNGCGKKFTRKFALDQHLKIHRQEKLYICSHCGKSYSDYFFLIKHQQMERASALRIPDSIMK
ncbi:uncharacterized protein LOC142094874 isoform X2 [Mixophyes fleayi]|uniref:uncharacterized protein LOC142094874 isoform X2 n=1 Tax=Mixophyes fleayi TaxID=3061075 RepID=UPI003F4D92EE